MGSFAALRKTKKRFFDASAGLRAVGSFGSGWQVCFFCESSYIIGCIRRVIGRVKKNFNLAIFVRFLLGFSGLVYR